MKAYVVGKGAIGTYLGDKLQSIGVEVTYAPRALEEVSSVAADVAIVATKAFQTSGAIETLRRAILDPINCVFVTPQNGVGNEELLAAAFGADNVVAAALTVPVHLNEQGAAIAANSGGIAFAPVGASAYNWLTATFASTGMNVRVIDDWRAMKWSKLALNVVANASCAILDMLPAQIVANTALFDAEIRMLREVRSVMRAEHLTPIDLPRYPTRALFTAAALPLPLARLILGRSIAGGRGTKPPSLLLDVRAGKPHTEVSVLNGAVAAAAHAHQIPTPVNATYAAILEEISNNPDAWSRYRKQPQALIAAIEGASHDHA